MGWVVCYEVLDLFPFQVSTQQKKKNKKETGEFGLGEFCEKLGQMSLLLLVLKREEFMTGVVE